MSIMEKFVYYAKFKHAKKIFKSENRIGQTNLLPIQILLNNMLIKNKKDNETIQELNHNIPDNLNRMKNLEKRMDRNHISSDAIQIVELKIASFFIQLNNMAYEFY